MVKRSKKSKSKRVPLKKKYKILKKVKEHHKKKAKEAKKQGVTKSKVEKDPGIPNDWPFKEQELKNLEARRAKAMEELEAKKAARKDRARKRKLGLTDDDGNDPGLADDLTETSMDESSNGMKKVQNNSDRAFYKELGKVIEASDVILEVLDARDPLGTRCIDMENMVRKAGPEKRLVLLLNKIDLVPRESVEKWLKYLREELPAVAFKCSTQEQRSNLGWKSASKKSKPTNILQTSDCLGAETLIKLLKNYSRNHELKMSITVGVIGLPNVGKSSLINSLKRSHVANVGSTPGLTRSMQEIQLDKNVKLLDCPGVVMLKSGESDASIALRNCNRIEKLDDPKSPVSEILNRCPAHMLISLYKIPTFEGVDDFLFKVGTVRGRLKKGGTVDTDAAARIVLHDWNEGKIPYFTMPPTRSEAGCSEVKIVSEFGKEFNVDEAYSGESSFIGSLKTLDDLQAAEVPPSDPLSFDETMLEDNVEPSSVGAQTENDMAEDDDQSMDDKDATKTDKKSVASKQNEKLYTAEGILNPKLKKAEKKRKKKATKLDSMGDDDYDFKVDYSKNAASMDVEDVENEEDDTINGDEDPSAAA
ncbi:unnamed protein product [Rhodiola kirilowii]